MKRIASLVTSALLAVAPTLALAGLVGCGGVDDDRAAAAPACTDTRLCTPQPVSANGAGNNTTGTVEGSGGGGGTATGSTAGGTNGAENAGAGGGSVGAGDLGTTPTTPGGTGAPTTPTTPGGSNGGTGTGTGGTGTGTGTGGTGTGAGTGGGTDAGVPADQDGFFVPTGN